MWSGSWVKRPDPKKDREAVADGGFGPLSWTAAGTSLSGRHASAMNNRLVCTDIPFLPRRRVAGMLALVMLLKVSLAARRPLS